MFIYILVSLVSVESAVIVTRDLVVAYGSGLVSRLGHDHITVLVFQTVAQLKQMVMNGYV